MRLHTANKVLFVESVSPIVIFSSDGRRKACSPDDNVLVMLRCVQKFCPLLSCGMVKKNWLANGDVGAVRESNAF